MKKVLVLKRKKETERGGGRDEKKVRNTIYFLFAYHTTGLGAVLSSEVYYVCGRVREFRSYMRMCVRALWIIDHA